jgi:hypothetical protein
VVADIEEEISQLNDYLARSEVWCFVFAPRLDLLRTDCGRACCFQPNMKAVDKYKDASARLQEKVGWLVIG